MAGVLSMAYESNLLSILVTIRYGKEIGSAEELYNSDLPIAVPAKTVVHALLKSSPNPHIK